MKHLTKHLQLMGYLLGNKLAERYCVVEVDFPYNKPIFEITPELLRLISEATELKTWIHGSIINVAWLPQLQKETALRLTPSSTSIEGNPLSLDEVKNVVEGKKISAWDKDKQKVVSPISEKTLLHLHRLITHKLRPENSSGHFKKKPTRVIDPQGRSSTAERDMLTCPTKAGLNGTVSAETRCCEASDEWRFIVDVYVFRRGNQALGEGFRQPSLPKIILDLFHNRNIVFKVTGLRAATIQAKPKFFLKVLSIRCC